MIPLDSHAPRLPRAVAASTSVGPSSADWFTFATTLFAPVARVCFQIRAVVAFGSVDPNGNCWLEPGSSVTSRLVAVVSRLSGWWISPGALTGASSPSIRIERLSTFVGSLGSSTSFQIRPFVEIPGPVGPGSAAAAVGHVDHVLVRRGRRRCPRPERTGRRSARPRPFSSPVWSPTASALAIFLNVPLYEAAELIGKS